MRERGRLLGLSLMVAACGGEAEHGSRARGDAGSAAGGGGSAVGGAGSMAGEANSAAGGGGSAAGGSSTVGGEGGAETDGAVHEFTSDFETTQPQQSIGLWMGLGDPLPIAMPPVAHDGAALHLVGDSGMGLDVFFHTPLPVERIASEVRFSAYSPEASTLTVGIAGPDATYFSDHEAGVAWPETAFQVGAKWKNYSFSLDELSPTPPHEETFGAVHFVVPPGVHYDFWIDDFTLVSRSR